jgi:hypothetical protein
VAVDHGSGLIRVRREGAAVIVAPGEVRTWRMRSVRRRRGWGTSRLATQFEHTVSTRDPSRYRLDGG